MLSLLEIQNLFKASVIDKTKIELANYICANHLTAQRCLQIYRNNIFITLTESLQSLYPTIQKLVGEEFFTGLAKEYIVNFPPVSGDIQTFGDRFSEFLVAFSATQTLPYLSEIAQLEWAYHRTFHAADHVVLDLNKLKNISEIEYGKLKFSLHPSSRLFDFRYPVLRIWQICQEENDNQENIHLAEGGIKILVIRRQLAVNFETLTAGEFALLAAFNDGLLFEVACANALAVEENFAIGSCLQKHILSGTIVGFSY